MSGQTASLGEVADFVNGVAFKEDDWGDEGRPIIRIQNLNDRSKPFNRTIREVGDRNIARRGDLLVSWAASLGVYTWHGEEACVNQHIFKVIPEITRVDPGYLKRALETSISTMERESHGATMKHITRDRFLSIRIPLPSLGEQRRTAAILDKADALRAKRREAIAKLEQLLQSVFLETFGDLIANPFNWPKESLGELVVVDAPLVDPLDPRFENLLHFGPDRIEKNSGRLLEAKSAREDGLVSKKFLCGPQHVLYSKIRPYLNKVALVERECLCSADVYPIEPRRLSRRYLWHVLRSESFLKHAATFSNRANIPKINRSQLLQYECLVPPAEVQERFDQVSEKFDQLGTKARSAIRRMEECFHGLERQAFIRAL